MEVVLAKNDNDIVEAYWEMLSTLSRKVKLGLASRLTNSVLQEELSESPNAVRRTATIKHHSLAYSDEEMDALFADKAMHEIPSGDSSWSDIIQANSGKTIKSIEKWL